MEEREELEELIKKYSGPLTREEYMQWEDKSDGRILVKEILRLREELSLLQDGLGYI